MAIKQKRQHTRAIPGDREQACKNLEAHLRQDERIQGLYLFGSQATGRENSDSDIDLAFFTMPGGRQFSWDDYYKLIGEGARIIHSDRLDLVWMNNADPILCFEIIKTGQLLFYRDAETLNNFELARKKCYYDYCIYLKKHRRFRQIGL